MHAPKEGKSTMHSPMCRGCTIHTIMLSARSRSRMPSHDTVLTNASFGMVHAVTFKRRLRFYTSTKHRCAPMRQQRRSSGTLCGSTTCVIRSSGPHATKELCSMQLHTLALARRKSVEGRLDAPMQFCSAQWRCSFPTTELSARPRSHVPSHKHNSCLCRLRGGPEKNAMQDCR